MSVFHVRAYVLAFDVVWAAVLLWPAQMDWYNPVYLKAHEHGGHFTPWENPEAVIEDIRATFRNLR